MEPDRIAGEFPDVDFLYDSGTATLGQASAVVRDTGPQLEVLREGTLAAEEILRMAAATVLFVCTGNTCRSPMAEVIARQQVAHSLGVEPPAVLARGLHLASAGTMTGGGSPASDQAIAAAGELGLDLTAHRSRAMQPDLVRQAARIYALTRSHLEMILLTQPAAAPKCKLLDPQDRDIPDPFGGDLATYRVARGSIEAAVKARLPEILGSIES